jgi:WD40 repeat protein
MNERSIFIEALGKETAAERSEYLAAACGPDTAMRQRVEALLRSHEQAGDFLGETAPERLAAELATPESAGNTAGEPPATDSAEPLDFLEPSANPEALGRLGHYEILEAIGRGGMGIVLRAVDERLNRTVAIKVLAPPLAASGTSRKRFTREAHAAAAVRDEHVVGIYAVEEANGLPYLVMEYVAGQSLQQRLDRTGPLVLAEVLRVGMQTAAGLAAAHAQGLIHRDVKPANILLENGVERVRITDFGLARAVDDASLTQSGLVAGTPQYMAPEQAGGGPVDHRADLFSLGSLLFAACTGRPPFHGDGTMATLKRVCEDDPRPIRETNPEIPEWLAGIIAKLQAKDRAKRFQSAAEVAELLGRRLAHVQQPGLVPMPAVPPTDVAPRRRRRLSIAAAVFVLIGGVGATEATGVTRLTATVIRVLTPDGTLVVEVDDPAVTVTVEGDGGLVITGAGPHEVRLRPGNYRVSATKDDRPVSQEVVSISRGGKRVVKVGLEAAGGAAPAVAADLLPHPKAYVLAISPQSRQILSGGFDHALRLWDFETRRQVHCFDLKDGVHNNAMYCGAVAPDGRHALAGNREGRVWLWDLRERRLLRYCDHPPWKGVGMTGLAYFADGTRALLASFGGIVRVWDVERWSELRRFQAASELWSVALSKDNRFALTASGGTAGAVQLWDLQQDKPRTLARPGHGVWQAVFSPDGRQSLWAYPDGTARLVDLDTAAEVRRFSGHSGEVRCVAFSPDGRRVLTGSHDGTARLWDAATGAQLECFEHCPGHEVPAVAFSLDGKVALSAGYDGVRIWRLRSVSTPPSPGP